MFCGAALLSSPIQCRVIYEVLVNHDDSSELVLMISSAM